MSNPLTLQRILHQQLGHYRRVHPLDARRLAVCGHLSDCRSAALGGVQLQCDHCDHASMHYYACRDRHCPQCQQHASAQWCNKQQHNLLPVRYFHLIFTLPHALNGWAQHHPEVIYRLLFHRVWHTLSAFGRDPKRLKGQLGMVGVLHTWGQNLSQHLHLHCLIPGGALSDTGQWRPAKSNYLFPVRALSQRFRGGMVGALREAFQAGALPRITQPGEPDKTLNALMQQAWVV